MNAFFYLLGLVIGIVCFLYALRFIESGRDKVRGMMAPDGTKSGKAMTVKPETVALRNADGLIQKTCPLCGSRLDRYEALYASRIDDQNGSRIFIYGCRHCYKPEEDPGRRKKSDI